MPGLLKILTDPGNFKFYTGGKGHVSNSTEFGQTSIPFGKDRPGGGSSKEPLIVSKEGSLKRYVDKFASQINSEDFILRGGTLAPVRAIEDASRIFQLFTQTTRGPLFIAKQNLLSNLGTSLDGGYNVVVQGLFRNPVNEGVYTGLNTILQSAGNAFGVHLPKQGVNPLTGGPKYMTLVSPLGADEAGIRNKNVNRLIYLYRGKIKNKDGANDSLLFSYKGGPGSFLGLTGETKIYAASDRTFGQYENFSFGGLFRTNKYLSVNDDVFSIAGGLDISPETFRENGSNLNKLYKRKLGTPNGNLLYIYNGGEGVGEIPIKVTEQTQTRGTKDPLIPGLMYTTFTQQQIQDAKPVGAGGSTLVPDFRKKLSLLPKSIISDSPDYTKKNIEQRVNLGDPGQRGLDRSNYTRGIIDEKNRPVPLDKTNALYLYKSEGVTQDKRKNDLIKFRIAVIDNDTPKEKVFAHFRAFINNFSDNMSASWNSFKYTGRGENFYTYDGFSSSYNIEFTVIAQSIAELSIMYQKLNYIKSTLAPDYSKQGYMRGNIAQLTMGGYLYEVPGIIESFNITIPQDTTWEIGIPASTEQSTEARGSNGFTDSAVKELPHRVEVSMGFRPIYKFLPERVKDIYGAGNITQRFISLEDAEDTKDKEGNIVANNLYNNGIDNIYRVDKDKVVKEEQEQ